MSSKPTAVDHACPCGTGKSMVQCCGRWHGGEPAPNAEALMRSRYSAFAIRNEAYLLKTWCADRRPAAVPMDPQQKWLGLKIISAIATSPDAAEVEFIARYRIGGNSAARLHERSRFIKEQGQWLYVDGTILP